jgi:hypothetical protein
LHRIRAGLESDTDVRAVLLFLTSPHA